MLRRFFYFFIFFFTTLSYSSAVYSQCLSLAVTSVDVSCYGGNDGQITLTITPGTPPDAQAPYTIELFFRDSGGGLTQLASHNNVNVTSITFTPGNGSLNLLGAEDFGIPANDFVDPGSDYKIDVRSTGGDFICRNKTTFTSVGSPTEIQIDALTSQNATCAGVNDGEIVVSSVSGGGGGPYEYSINNGVTFQAGNAFSGLAAETYDVVVKDVTACNSFASQVVLTSFPVVTIDAISSQNVSCNGGNNGEIIVDAVSGGDGGPYEYSVDNGTTFQASNTFSGLIANGYDVMARDVSGCTSGVSQVNITEPAAPVGGTTTQVDIACFGESTGSITITGQGGVGPYDFSIDGGATYTAMDAPDQTFPNLPAAIYDLMVRDANGCESPLIQVTLTEPSSSVTGSTTEVDVSCFGASTGSITITGAGGISPYDFSIDAGGSYAVLDAANHTFSGLTAGTYDLMVRDANECESILIQVTITEPAASVSGNTTHVDVSCFEGNNGSITITGAGGVGPYDFSLDGGITYPALAAADHTFGALAAGDYDLIVRDANGCESGIIGVTLTQPATAVSGTTTQIDITCFGQNTGSITITGAGGVGPYDFSIDGGGTYPALAAADHTFASLPAGDYDLVVRDANGCASPLIPVTLIEPSASVSGATTQIDVSCFGESTGSITITGAGGVAPYDFSIDGGATYPVIGAADHTFSGLSAGDYDLMSRDANGCASLLIGVTITEPAAAVSGNTAQVDVSCFGASTGSITVTGAGGVGPYDFSIDGGTSYAAVAVADHTFNNLAAGDYDLIVRDANGCASPLIVVTITEPATSVAGSTTHVDVSCFGESTGSITITGAGGVGPYDFSADGGSTYPVLGAADYTFSGLSAGSYTLMVRDANGCASVAIPVTLTEPSEVTALTSAVGAVTVCEGSALPDIVFTFTGIAPFNFTYTDGVTPVSVTAHPSTSFTIVSAPAGDYSVTSLSDDNGCVATDLGASVLVTEEPAPTSEAGPAQTICASTTATLTGSSIGGSATTGAWGIVSQPAGGDGALSDGSQSSTPDAVTFTANVDGAYVLRLTTNDPAGACEAETDDVVITVVASATADAGADQTICVGGDATLAGTFSGTTGVTWLTSGDGSFDDPSLANAVYSPGPADIASTTVTLTLTTAGPCAPVSDDVVITIDAAPVVDAGIPQTICSTASIVLNGSFMGSATGLSWSTSGNGSFDDATDPNATYTPGANDITNGTVTLTATATGSCPGTSDDVVITIDPAATVDAGSDQTVCFGSDVSLNGNFGGAATTMTWTTSGDGTFDDNTLPGALYTPGTTDEANGTVTLTLTTNNPPGPCPAASDNVAISLIAIPGDQTTAGIETWIGYVYDDTGDPTPIPGKIDFDNAKYKGFFTETDIPAMSAASSYDIDSDAFDLALNIAESVQGPNVCGSYRNNFSVRYKMEKTFTAGVYRFTVGGDDGVRLLVDGVNVLPAEAFYFQSYTEYITDPICISAGVHDFEIHYFDNTAQSRVSFNYEEVPAVTTNGPLAVCINSPAPTLSVSSTDADVIDFNWYKDATLVFTGADYTPAASELDMTTEATTTFEVTAIYACGETQPVDIVVDVLNAATLITDPQTICESAGGVDLRTLVQASPAGGTFVFSGHAAISGNDFDPTGLAGSTVSILVDYSTGSCTAPQATLDLTITNTATIAVPDSPVVVCELSPDIDLTTLVSAVPSGGTFTFTGPQVSGNLFDPSGLSGIQSFTVDYAFGACAAAPVTLELDVTSTATLTITNATVCESGSPLNLTSLVSATPGGGTLTFTGAGVSGNLFDPSGQAGVVDINVDYDAQGCTDAAILSITVVNATDPLCTGGNCATVVIVPKTEPATCTNSDGRMVMSIDPFTPTVNNTGIKISIDGVSSTNLEISRTIYNDSIFDALPVGKYDYVIEYGDPSCIKTGTFSIDQSGTVGTPVVSNVVSPLCPGTATGSLTLEVPGETGNVLEWSLDAGLTDPFKPFTAGSQITGLRAGNAPTYELVISVRRNVADVCYASVTVAMPESVSSITATFSITPATCNGNDGAITDIVANGGNDAPFTYSIDGQTYQTAPEFNGLSGGSYALRVRDAAGCVSDFTADVTFPGFINSVISKNNADCSNGGDSGSISVTVNDAGVFEVALSTDQFNEPAESDYQAYSNPSVAFNGLSRGEYFVYVRSASGSCPTRSAPINIFGVYDITFDLQPDCNNNELSLALLNVTGDANGAPLEIQVSKALSSDPPEIIYQQFPADGEIYLDHDLYTFLQTPGEYRLKIIQFQNEVICNFSSAVVNFTVPEPLVAQISMVEESYPDIPTGKLHVSGFSGGVFPFDVRIELDSAASFSLPYYVTEFEEAGLNENQQVEMTYDGVPAGRYQVDVRDAQGCVLGLIARVPLDVDLFIPNVFTPNGDGSNDVFFIRNLPQEPAENRLSITNRWGKQVFTSENYQNNWDAEGTSDGIYFYKLEVADEFVTGWVEILRGQKP